MEYQFWPSIRLVSVYEKIVLKIEMKALRMLCAAQTPKN